MFGFDFEIILNKDTSILTIDKVSKLEELEWFENKLKIKFCIEISIAWYIKVKIFQEKLSNLILPEKKDINNWKERNSDIKALRKNNWYNL